MRKVRSVGVPLSAIMGLLVVLLVSAFADSAKQAYDRRAADNMLLTEVDLLSNVYRTLENYRLSQGYVNTALTTPMVGDSFARRRMVAAHAAASDALVHLIAETRAQEGEAARSYIARILKAAARYEMIYAQARRAVDMPLARRPDLQIPWRDAANEMALAIDARSRIHSVHLASVDALTNEMVKVNNIIWTIRPPMGVERREVARAIGEGKVPGDARLQQLAELDGRLNQPWSALQNDKTNFPGFPAELAVLVDRANDAYFVKYRALRAKHFGALTMGKPPGISVEAWLDASDSAMQKVMAVSAAAMRLSRQDVAARLVEARVGFETALVLMMLSIGLALAAFFYVIMVVVRPLRAITQAMQAVAASNVDAVIPFQGRPDEIGQFARALCRFRDSNIEKDKLQEEVRENQVAKEAAEASSRVKSQFLANMSHELRTPLNAIIGFSDLIKNQMFGPLHARYAEYAGIINESGNHLLNLVSDILDIAKIEAGKFVLDFQDVDLQEAMNYCLSLVKTRADESGITLAVKLPSGPLVFSADQRAFRQILLNLLSNAVKFTRAGGQVTVRADVVGDNLRLCVSDTGIGMSQSLLARVGRPFEQAVSDPVHAREGTGLGLSLVRSMVQQHGGNLHIESREGEGTTVSLELPLFQAARQAA